ncbi:MAG: NfeD family protein, partial [Clostridia bacterium]|nr:NfeD family protein [Clostridia bacterium]
MTILWICVTLLAIVLEIVTIQLVSLWFVGGGIVAFVMSLFDGVSWQWQLLAFILVSVILLI